MTKKTIGIGDYVEWTEGARHLRVRYEGTVVGFYGALAGIEVRPNICYYADTKRLKSIDKPIPTAQADEDTALLRWAGATS
jgi:hypothetical protein